MSQCDLHCELRYQATDERKGDGLYLSRNSATASETRLRVRLAAHQVHKAYCEEVVTEVAAWLKQQPHKPEIRSLAALQNLWHSDEHAARTLMENFNSSGAVPVRMGGNDDQLDAVLIALAEASRGRNTPVELPPSNIARRVERLVHGFFHSDNSAGDTPRNPCFTFFSPLAVERGIQVTCRLPAQRYFPARRYFSWLLVSGNASGNDG